MGNYRWSFSRDWTNMREKSTSKIEIYQTTVQLHNLMLNVAQQIKPQFTLLPLKTSVTTTYIQDLVLAEAESLRLFGGWESSLEGLTSGRSCGCVSVTLRQNPVTHQALQKGGQAATHFQDQLLKGLLGALPYPAIVVLIDIQTKLS